VNMKLHTLEKLYLSLREGRYKVYVPEKIANLSRKAVEAMLETKETLA